MYAQMIMSGFSNSLCDDCGLGNTYFCRMHPKCHFEYIGMCFFMSVNVS